MKNLIALVIVALLAWQGYKHYQSPPEPQGSATPSQTSGRPAMRSEPVGGAFRCDGRAHCAQMTSCAEATYFLQHCPGTKMDGNNDGIPCEQQWCRQ